MREQILKALARGYCLEKNKHKVLDPDLIEGMCEEVLLSFQPTQGLITQLTKAELKQILGLIEVVSKYDLLDTYPLNCSLSQLTPQEEVECDLSWGCLKLKDRIKKIIEDL